MSTIDNAKWEDRVVSPGEVLAHIKPGMTIFLGSGVAEPRTLMKTLIDSGLSNTNDLELIQLTSHSDIFSLKKLDWQKYRLKTFFSTWASTEAVVAGSVDLIPGRFSQIPRIIKSKRLPIDVAFIQITPPNEAGYCSLGVAIDVAREAMIILHADGETLLTDPGRGLYTRQYFGPERYDNIFANSYGHSVPRLGDQLQGQGREFSGEFVNVDMAGPTKNVEIEFGRAYSVVQLAGARRHILLDETGTVWLQDTFSFADNPLEVEEAFITWLNVEAKAAIAIIQGQHHHLQLTIESPEGLHFEVEPLIAQCRTNAKPGVLKRITAVLPVATDPQLRVRMEIIKK